MDIQYRPVYRIEYGARYIVSDAGHIFRVKETKSGEKCYTPIVPYWAGREGYKRYQVNLYDAAGNIWKVSASKLILGSFVGFPEDYRDYKRRYFTRYKDGDVSNLRLDNLEWTTDRYWLDTIVSSTRCKAVMCLETGDKFPSIKKCAEFFQCNVKTASASLNELNDIEKKKFLKKYILVRI